MEYLEALINNPLRPWLYLLLSYGVAYILAWVLSWAVGTPSNPLRGVHCAWGYSFAFHALLMLLAGLFAFLMLNQNMKAPLEILKVVGPCLVGLILSFAFATVILSKNKKLNF